MLEHISSNTQNWMRLILLNISLSKYKQKQMILQGLHGWRQQFYQSSYADQGRELAVLEIYLNVVTQNKLYVTI